MLRVYLDTCIISGLAKQDISQKEQEALLTILQKRKMGELEVVTSDMSRRELEKVPDEFRLKHEFIYNLLTDVPIAKAFRTDSGLTLMGVGGGRRLVKEMAQLNTLLKDGMDAAHIYQSFKNEVFEFLTVDEKSILSQKNEIENICGVKVMFPSQFVENYLVATNDA